MVARRVGKRVAVASFAILVFLMVPAAARIHEIEASAPPNQTSLKQQPAQFQKNSSLFLKAKWSSSSSSSQSWQRASRRPWHLQQSPQPLHCMVFRPRVKLHFARCKQPRLQSMNSSVQDMNWLPSCSKKIQELNNAHLELSEARAKYEKAAKTANTDVSKHASVEANAADPLESLLQRDADHMEQAAKSLVPQRPSRAL